MLQSNKRKEKETFLLFNKHLINATDQQFQAETLI